MGYTWVGETSDRTLGASGVWTDVDVSGSVPVGGVMALLLVYNPLHSSPETFGVRNNGSSDTRTFYTLDDSYSTYVWVGLDSNRLFEAKTSNTSVAFRVLGYITNEIATARTNALIKDYSGGSDAWTTVDCSGSIPASATGVLVNSYTTNTTHTGFRTKGSSGSLLSGGTASSSLVGGSALVALNGSQQYECRGLSYQHIMGTVTYDFSQQNINGSTISTVAGSNTVGITTPGELIVSCGACRFYQQGYTYPAVDTGNGTCYMFPALPSNFIIYDSTSYSFYTLGVSLKAPSGGFFPYNFGALF